MIGLLTGCAATQQPSAVNQLQIKVSQIENKLEAREQELSDLKYEVSELSSQMENQPSAPASPATDESAGPASQAKTPSVADQNILRVAISGEELQRALKSAGYYDGTIDGKVGAKTKKSIEQFQKDHNLKADGVVGKRTWSELKTYLKEN